MMWKDIERISGVPFSRSDSNVSRDSQSNIDEFETSTRRLDSLRIALERETTNNASTQIELHSKKIALLDATSRADELEQMNKLLQDTVEKLGTENNAVRHDLLQLTASASSKSDELEQLREQMKQLESRLADLSTSNDDLAKQYSQTRHELELSQQQNLDHESEIKRLELRLTDVTKQHRKDTEAAELELKQTRAILQAKLDHAYEQLKVLEEREMQAHEAKREAVDELPKLMATFKAEREAIRAEMTKVRRILAIPEYVFISFQSLSTSLFRDLTYSTHNEEVEKYKSHLKNASTQLKEMDSRLAKQEGEFRMRLNDVEKELQDKTYALEATRVELEDKTSQYKRLEEEVVEQLKEDVNCIRDKYRDLQKEKADESQASQELVERLQHQVEEAKELLEKERSANAAALHNLENTIVAMVRDNFSSRMKDE